jgi:hypothetical protein
VLWFLSPFREACCHNRGFQKQLNRTVKCPGVGIKRVDMAAAKRDFGMRHTVCSGGNIYFVCSFYKSLIGYL